MSGTETPAFPAFDEPFRAERSPFLWLLEPEVLRFLTIWRYSVVGLVLSTVLFVVVFGSALGRHADTIDGIGYGSFIVPGLFTQAIVNVGFFNGTTSLFEARHDQYVDDVFASPLRWREFNAAPMGGGVARGIVVGAGVLAVALALTHGGAPARPRALLPGTLGCFLSPRRSVCSRVATRAPSITSTPWSRSFCCRWAFSAFWDALSRLDPVFWLVQVERIGFLGPGDVGAGWALAVVWGLAAALTAWSAAISAPVGSGSEPRNGRDAAS